MWQPIGKEGTIRVKTNSGRKRINILGALNFKDLSVIQMITEDKCNAVKVVQFIQQVREKYPNKDIVIVLDNAKYNLANYTTVYAELCGVELFFLPSYCPNLNLIERLWKFSKKKLVHNKYYEKFSDFVEAVNNFFRNLRKYGKELKEILTRKFEIIETV